MDSRPFVVFSDRPSTPYNPEAMQRRVSSRPDCRPPIGSDPPAHAGATGGRRGPRRTPDGCRRAGDAAAIPAAHACHSTFSRDVPLTPLHQGAVAEGFPHGRPESLAAIHDHQKPLGDIEAPLDQGPEERGQHLLVLRVRRTKPRNRLSGVMPSATTIVASANVLPSSTRATTSSPRGPAPGVSKELLELSVSIGRIEPHGVAELRRKTMPQIAGSRGVIPTLC